MARSLCRQARQPHPALPVVGAVSRGVLWAVVLAAALMVVLVVVGVAAGIVASAPDGFGALERISPLLRARLISVAPAVALGVLVAVAALYLGLLHWVQAHVTQAALGLSRLLSKESGNSGATAKA